ncbi:MAG: membrane protein insertion efficiency factor YidD [Saprospiraceae bacterium]
MKTIVTISLCLLAAELSAQSPAKADLDLLARAFAPEPKVRLREQFTASRQNPNELQLVFSGLFLFYKSFISSQDQNRCNFHPSCSEFGLQAIKKLGFVRGAVCTFDRMSRCNGLSPELYEVDLNRKLLLDPVKW